MGWSAPDVRISHAQNLEDIRLWKALADREPGFWVDVGAADPDRWSVTRFFSERGWTGINVEPGPDFDALVERRPRDVNVRAAVGVEAGTVAFTISWPIPSLSSLDPVRAGARPEVERTERIEVPMVPLRDLLADHAAGRAIDFLKVDVEGAELAVLESNDWARFRPSVVLVEAIDSVTRLPNHDEWEPVLLDAGYEFVVFDGLNRFYVPREAPGCAAALAEQICVFDVSAFAPELEIRDALTERAREFEREADRLAQVVALRDRQLAEVWSSTTWRVGRGVVGVLAVPRRGGALARRRLGRLRRRWRSRPAAVRRAVAAATAPGARFEALHDRRLTVVPTTPLERFVADRRAVPGALRRRLTPDEVAALLAALAADAETDPAVTAAARRLADWCTRTPVTRGDGRTVVVDAQGVQLPIRCGTRTHALHVLEALLDGIDRRVPVRLLVNPDLPVPPAWALDRTDGVWGPDDDLAEVGAFVQLMTLRVGPYAPQPVGPFLAPGVERLGVWLDGMYLVEYAYYGTEPAVRFDLQTSVEQLADTDEVLALTRFAATVLPEGLAERARVTVTGSRGAFGALTATPLPVERRTDAGPDHLLVVGKIMPHKNVVTGLAAAVLAQRRHRDLRVVAVVDAFPDDERDLWSFLGGIGADLDRIEFRFQPDDDEFARLVGDAAAVVIPSLHEGYSLPVLEAIGSGTPVVCSDIPVHRELLGDAPGFADPRDPVALAAAIDDVVTRRDEVLAAQRAAFAPTLTPDAFTATVTRVGADLAGRLLGKG